MAPNFTIDPARLGGYRARAEAARAAWRDNSDNLRFVRGEALDIVQQSRANIESGRAGFRNFDPSKPLEGVHEEDQKRHQRLSTEIDRLSKEDSSLDHAAAYANSMASLVVQFAKDAEHA